MALRNIHSSTVYVLGTGLYSWISDYSQDCVGTNNSQTRSVDVQPSFDLWIYNLCTKAIVEMISPHQGKATLVKERVNGFLSSIRHVRDTMHPASYLPRWMGAYGLESMSRARRISGLVNTATVSYLPC